MNKPTLDWRAYLKTQRASSAVHFIEQYFRRFKITEPSLEDIAAISKTELLNSWISIPTMKEIELLQQKIREHEQQS